MKIVKIVTANAKNGTSSLGVDVRLSIEKA